MSPRRFSGNASIATVNAVQLPDEFINNVIYNLYARTNS